jgi:hypothetical protein
MNLYNTKAFYFVPLKFSSFPDHRILTDSNDTFVHGVIRYWVPTLIFNQISPGSRQTETKTRYDCFLSIQVASWVNWLGKCELYRTVFCFWIDYCDIFLYTYLCIWCNMFVNLSLIHPKSYRLNKNNQQNGGWQWGSVFVKICPRIRLFFTLFRLVFIFRCQLKNRMQT